MTLTYLVDGYNLIHAHPEFRLLLKRNVSEARHKLIEFLEEYSAVSESNNRFIVVFDSSQTTSRNKHENFSSHGIQIKFSTPPENADQYIRRLMLEQNFPSDTIVISSDRKDITNWLSQNQMRTLTSEKFLNQFPGYSTTEDDSETRFNLSNEVRAHVHKNETPEVRVHSNWVSIMRAQSIEALYMSISGSAQIRQGSQPEGVKMTVRNNRITLINQGKTMLRQDILFEFEGVLDVQNVQMIAEDGGELALVVKYIKL